MVLQEERGWQESNCT